MSDAAPCSAFLQLAEKVFKREIKLNTLADFIPTLPPLNHELLEQLAEESEKASLSQPRMSWAICYVAEKTSRHQKLDLFTRSLAAWYLGLASNHWMQPQKVAKAIARAHRGFSALGEKGWMAACDWILNDSPWTCKDLLKSEAILINCIEMIAPTNLSMFMPKIFLTLAQINILLEKFYEAQSYIAKSETLFKRQHDELNIARCWMVSGNCCRRMSQFDNANVFFQKSEKVFRKFNAISDLGKLFFYQGIGYLYSTTDFELTSEKFQNAIMFFSKTDITIWKGMSFTYLGVTYMQIGQLAQASIFYKKALSLLQNPDAEFAIAENQTASARLNILLGYPDKSLIQSQKAREIHSKTGRIYLVGVDSINIGEAYYQLGRYQEALHEYEVALTIFTKIDDKVRIGLLQQSLANFWIIMNDFEFANQLLMLAESNASISNQADTKIVIGNLKALVQYKLMNFEQAHNSLTTTLTLAQNENLKPQIAITKLNFGNFYLAIKEYHKAINYLEDALLMFEEFGSITEIIICKNSMGYCFMAVEQIELARNSFNEALTLSSNSFNEHDWQAYAGLAELNEPPEALQYYRLMMISLNTIRETFWQPDLAGSYSYTPSQIASKAIQMATKLNRPDDALFFIESDKAISFQQQFNLTRQTSHDPLSDKLADAKAEMRWLRQQIQAYALSGDFLQLNPQNQELQNRLRTKREYCENLIAQLDRKQTGVKKVFQQQEFSLSAYRELLTSRIGPNWTVLDYYQQEEQIISVLITGQICQTFAIPLTPRLKKAVRICQLSHTGTALPSTSDLKLLGLSLVPQQVLALLQPDHPLIILPHQSLHGIPWAAIGEVPLVTRCIPVIAPSLKSLALIWLHNNQGSSSLNRQCLLAGISNFEGRHPDLPAVEQELALLQDIGGLQLTRISGNISTFDELNRCLKNPNRNPYDCLHMATHFFTDTENGRLNGFALQKEDLFIDQLRDLAPLPSLVTFSGCNSLFSQVYPGDEQISLPNTCFLSGTANVLGSVWPVLDQSTIPIMNRFYTYFLSGVSPAQALATAQRDSLLEGQELRSWAGFSCLGIP